jgi:hypothetical protein
MSGVAHAILVSINRFVSALLPLTGLPDEKFFLTARFVYNGPTRDHLRAAAKDTRQTPGRFFSTPKF